jgi:hypothetical protein
VKVEIDQTGYLKCIKTGMYLVDSRDDGFELSDEEIKEFEERGIIKVISEQSNSCHQPARIDNSDCKGGQGQNLNRSVRYR